MDQRNFNDRITKMWNYSAGFFWSLYNENKDRSGQNTSLSNNENKDRSGQNTSLSNVNAQNEITSDVLQQPNLDIEASRINLNRQQRTSVSQPMLQVPNITIDNIVTSSNSSSVLVPAEYSAPPIAASQQQISIQPSVVPVDSGAIGYMQRTTTDSRFDLQTTLQKMRQPGVPSEQYRNVEVVSPNLRNQILSGKDINLALLLMPNNDSLTEFRRTDFNGIEYSMRPGDPRLAKNLSLGEFISAFAKYRNIICEVMPHRREELDFYERDIVEMAQRFGGTRFYEYHKAFAAKAAALLHQRGIKVDWAVRDNGLYCTVFAGMRANVCSLCSSVNHTSEFCSLVVNPYWKRATQQMNGGIPRFPSPNANMPQQSKRYNQTFFQGIPLCINYNERSCVRSACRYLHLCSDCYAPHPKSKCNKTKSISEVKTADKKNNGKNDNPSSQ